MIKFLLFVLATRPLPAASSTIGSAYHGAEQPLGAPADERRLIHFPLKPHQRQRRLLTTESQDNNIAPLYQGIGTHYVDLYVGTPIRQKQTPIVDTGSEWTGFPCVPGCCGQHTDDEFNVSASSTFSKHERSCNSDQEQESCAQKQLTSCSDSNDECRVRMDYSEESFWTAYEAVDQVSIVAGNKDSTTLLLQFGCQTDTTRLFRTQLADGIMGMTDAPLSFWRQAGAESFSLCFSSPMHGDLEDQAGSMSVGGYDERLHLSEIQFAKRTKGRGPERNYRVEVRDLSLRQDSTNGDGTAAIKPLQGLDANLINQHGTIVDSGTTDTYFPTSAGSAFRSSFRDLTGMTWSNKMQLSRKQLQTLPTLVVHLAGADGDDDVLVEIPPLHYMQPSYAEDEMYEPTIFFESSETVLGANFLRGHNVHFASDTIGFAPSTCDYRLLDPSFNDTQPSHHQPASVKLELGGTSDDNTGNTHNPTFGLVGGVLLTMAAATVVTGMLIKRREADFRRVPHHELPLEGIELT